jgi:hypothetical protein
VKQSLIASSDHDATAFVDAGRAIQGIMPKLDEVVAAVQRIRDAGMTVLIIEQRMAECLEIADAPTSCRPAAC